MWDSAKRRRNLARAKVMREADKARDASDPVRAAMLYQEILDQWGPHFGVMVQLGNALKDSKSFEQAEQVYRAALQLDPLDADCHLQLGHLMKLSGRLDRAAEYYAEANRLAPALEDAIVELRTIETRKAPVAEETGAATPDGATEPAMDAPDALPISLTVDRHSRTFIVHQRLANNMALRRN